MPVDFTLTKSCTAHTQDMKSGKFKEEEVCILINPIHSIRLYVKVLILGVVL